MHPFKKCYFRPFQGGFCQKSPQFKVDQQKIDLLEIESAKNRSVKSRLLAEVDDVVISRKYYVDEKMG